MKVTDADLLDMELHDKVALNDGTEILRVLGGWVYTRFQFNQTIGAGGAYIENYDTTSVFVPWNLQ